MAHTDPHPRGHSIAGVLHRLMHSISLPRNTRPGRARAEVDGGLRLDPGTLHDIGASAAYRDYASRLTLGAGSQSRPRDLSHLARWGAAR